MSRTRNPFSVDEFLVIQIQSWNYRLDFYDTEKIGNKKSVNSQEIDKSSKLLSMIRGW